MKKLNLKTLMSTDLANDTLNLKKENMLKQKRAYDFAKVVSNVEKGDNITNYDYSTVKKLLGINSVCKKVDAQLKKLINYQINQKSLKKKILINTEARQDLLITCYTEALKCKTWTELYRCVNKIMYIYYRDLNALTDNAYDESVQTQQEQYFYATDREDSQSLADVNMLAEQFEEMYKELVQLIRKVGYKNTLNERLVLIAFIKDNKLFEYFSDKEMSLLAVKLYEKTEKDLFKDVD